MNAVELIEEVDSIVDEPSVTSKKILQHLNRGQLAIANKIFLPGLAGGHDTVPTVTNGYAAPLPDDFHRGLFLAQTTTGEIPVVKSIREIVSLCGALQVETGDILVVAAQTGNLFYQRVPEVATGVELFYHRKPVPMEEKKDSFPDGLTDNGGQGEAFEQALIYFACWKMYLKMEEGLEGAKTDTKEYKGLFNDAVDDLKLLSVREGISYPKPLPNKVW